MIVETYRIASTDSDILNAPSRLTSIPYDGQLILEFQASANDGTNYGELTVQLSDGSTPLENVRVPEGVTDGALNANDKYVVSVPAIQGGHIIVALTVNGTVATQVRATLMP